MFRPKRKHTFFCIQFFSIHSYNTCLYCLHAKIGDFRNGQHQLARECNNPHLISLTKGVERLLKGSGKMFKVREKSWNFEIQKELKSCTGLWIVLRDMVAVS